MAASRSITYLVSGAEDIVPTERLLNARGRTVRHDTVVKRDASAELKSGQAYVVIAHGRPSEVYWFRSDTGKSTRWLWVGMAKRPKGSRLYLYACYAGPGLTAELSDCECFGHENVVPIPEESADEFELVADFLDEVHLVVGDKDFDPVTWRARLATFVNDRLADMAERGGDAGRRVMALMILRTSLGCYDG